MSSPPALHLKEKLFINYLNRIIQRHISDHRLTVHQLTQLTLMSRSNLHRKIQRYTGMSTSEYIRFVRINRSAKLLLTKYEWSISRIALEVGFNNHGYFSKRFKEVYKVAPKEFREKMGR